ncbi:MAG: CD225/dispanin family protein [Phycisphaerae bacterium]|jgi:hypothetical protein|nr:CD225/dispanin family protein [Phycisphaerae bacterium]MCZ2398780.1 CD225/dispanin family protein [Phycisphaerae bacterium]NUQ49269.1 CD225/dispanin family protein [Phycisphaerae bacterium]
MYRAHLWRQAGAEWGGGQPGQKIPNYLVPAILTTIFCCLPFGIVSIVYAAQVDSKARTGDVAGAMAASANAKKWAYLSAGFGIVIAAISIVIQVIGFMAAAAR